MTQTEAKNMETRLREQDGNTKGNNQHHNIKPELQQYNIQNYNMTINKTPKYSPNSKLWVNDPRDHDSLLKQASYIGATWCNVCQMSFFFLTLSIYFGHGRTEREQGKKQERNWPRAGWNMGYRNRISDLSAQPAEPYWHPHGAVFYFFYS